MWSFFSRDPTSGFPYEVGDKVPGLEDKTIWGLHNGKKKGSGEVVSIFTFDIKSSSESQVQVARAAFKRIKTLRHPNILTYSDGIENDKVIYFVTEHVTPLETYIQNKKDTDTQTKLAISWGLHQIVKGLSFLINDCNLIHNNVCLPSVFVDKAGEWKLAGVEYMYATQGPDSLPPVKILPYLERYDPPEKNDIARGRKNVEKWSTDMWGLGCLIWEVFNGTLARPSSLKSLGKIPKPLVAHYCELVGANPKSRPNPQRFIDECRSKAGFMNNKFVDAVLFLEEFQIKEQTEKNQFFSGLATYLDDFPQQFCKYKILPQLLNAYEFGNAGSTILAPLFKLSRLMDPNEYQSKIVPCVVKLFSSTDRQMRVKLLQQIDTFIEHLQSSTVNDKIFPSIVQGLMDTNPLVREQTIKAMVQLASKLNYKNLNEELMKHFARLQSKDDQGGIRTNTTVCLGKIACYLHPQIRQKVLPSAFMRSIKDPFSPSRQAGVLAMAACHPYFTLKDIATRLLPCVCSLTVDPERGVRDQAFKAIKCFLEKLEKVSEDPDLTTEMEKDVNVGGNPAGSGSGWAGWAVSGMSTLTSKLYKGRQQAAVAAAAATNNNSQPNNTKDKEAVQTNNKSDTNIQPQKSSAVAIAADDGNEENPGDSWDDTWGEMKDEPTDHSRDNQSWDDGDWEGLEPITDSLKTKSVGSGGSLKLGSKKTESADSWTTEAVDDEDFAPIEDSSLKLASAYNWDGETETSADDFFSTVIEKDKKKPSSNRRSPPKSLGPNSQTLRSTNTAKMTDPSDGKWDQDGSGGWDDGWGDENAEDSGLSKAESAKKAREDKRKQKQKELQERRAAKQSGGSGAMKLGAKKLAAD